MNSIDSITLEVSDLEAARTFYGRAFELGDLLRLRASDAPTTGFRGYTLSLVVSQPSSVVALFDSAVAAGATTLKPAAKSLWGFGGVVQAPDGAVWTIATSSKKDTAPPNRKVDEVVLLLGVDDVRASKRFYVDHDLTVGKSVGSYVDFAMPESPIGLGLYRRGALAKTAGIAPDGSGSHRIVISGDEALTDPDGFVWEAA